MEAVQKAENKVFTVAFIYLLLTSFLDQRLYALAGRLASLVVFFVLSFLLLPHGKEIWAHKRMKAVLVAGTGILAMGNLIWLHSNKGAVLIPSDLALICLASDQVRLDQKTMKLTAALGGILTLVWYPFVRWDYNFNMAGLTFLLFMVMSVTFLELLKKEGKYAYLFPVQLLMWVTAFFYALLYHSRCALAGILVFGLSLLMMKRILRHRWIYRGLVLLLTLGSIAFTGLYVALAHGGANVTILYKEVLSGRQDIWRELWEAFLKHPLTGIGSSYVLKSFEIFEVHNGLFDILVVHGILVFILVEALLLMTLFSLERAEGSVAHIGIAAVFAMLAASFFENFFTVPPYSYFFFAFILFIQSSGFGSGDPSRCIAADPAEP